MSTYYEAEGEVLPDLRPIEAANVTEMALAARYVRLRRRGEEEEYAVWLVVGPQQFCVGRGENYEHACWFAWMLAKALAAVRSDEDG